MPSQVAVIETPINRRHTSLPIGPSAQLAIAIILLCLRLTSLKMKKPIYVTQPYLPPLEEFVPYLESIWRDKWVTNNGHFHQELEAALAEYLAVPFISLFTNGTLALMTALQTLRVGGEVITTPFSFVATTHALLWNDIKPVFVDIDPDSCNLDPEKIEAAITPHTTAIMPVHCYGNPCDVDRIQSIADTYGLKVIYDAAHAFKVEYRGESVLRHGDLSVLSFHATKVFNTCEGGAIVCSEAKHKQRIDFLKNFGFADEVTVVAPGINGKMNEIQAALGLLQLKHIDKAILRRMEIDRTYRTALEGVPHIKCLPQPTGTVHNYSYFPILIEPESRLSRDELYQLLRKHNIYARRYFYPLISDMPMYRGLPSAAPANLPQAKKIADQILCLPIYPDLTDEEQELVISTISRNAGAIAC